MQHYHQCLSILFNYFDSPTKLSDLAKFLDIEQNFVLPCKN